MAVDANAVTLGQYALMSNDPRVTGFTNSLIEDGSVMARDIPFVTDPTLVQRGSRFEGNLPTVDWTPLNTEGAVTSGTPTPWSAQAWVIRNRIQVDKFLMADKNQISSPMAIQVAAYAKGVAYDFNDKWINNTAALESNAVIGLRDRLDNAAVYGVRAANKINGGLTMTAGMTAVNANAVLAVLDEALWSVGSADGNDCVIYANEVFIRRFHLALRVLGTTGGLDTTRDQFDRVVTRYKGAIIRDIGYKADQATRIITATESAAGVDAASTFTSFYVVKFGRGMGLYGWQFAPMFVSAPFLTEGGAVEQVNIDWAGGLAMDSHRAIARVYNVNLG